MRDHPRVCGENRQRPQSPRTSAGSPPRVRGKPDFLLCDHILPGITPACAGKTRTRSSFMVFQRDHPRVCGENNQVLLAESTLSGSPPRVRGKQHFHKVQKVKGRITPACAGKTFTCMAFWL